MPERMLMQILELAERFAGVAKRYIAWLDNWSGTPDENALIALRFLPELYLVATALPDVLATTADDQVDPSHHPRWLALTQKLRSLPLDGYRKVFSPLKV